MRADDALARILAGVPPLPSVAVAILGALGLVLDEEVVADRDVPPFRNSAMDGYAVRARDVADAPASLRVIGEIAAGRSPTRTVGPGEAMRIMTGAPVPEGAETVVRVEDTDNRSDVVTINAATPPGTAVRHAGEDLRRGETVVARGTVLRAAEIGLLASVGRAQARVIKRPRVAVFSTGDELVDAGAPLAPGQIRDTNRYSLASALREAGAEPWVRGIVRDSPDALRASLRAQGRDEVARPRTKARLLEPIEKIASLRVFARGIHDPSAGTVRTTGPQGSGILRSLSLANCLIDLPEGRARHEAGEQVDVILTEQPEPRRCRR